MPDVTVKDPYSGKLMIVECHGDPPRDLFYRARGFFDPTTEYETEARLRTALSIRDGKSREYRQLRCPYTNRVIKPMLNERTGRWRATGVYYPGQMFRTAEQAVYELSRRQGRYPVHLPKPGSAPKIQVTELEPPPPSTCDDLGHVGDKAMEQIGNLLEDQL